MPFSLTSCHSINFLPFPAISAIFSHFQSCQDISGNYQPTSSKFKQFQAVINHVQPCVAIYSKFHKLPFIVSNFLSFSAISNFFLTFQVKFKPFKPCTTISSNFMSSHFQFPAIFRSFRQICYPFKPFHFITSSF